MGGASSQAIALNPKLQNSAALPSITPSGGLYAVLAYFAWGLLPIYWKLFGQTPAIEVLSHRMIWSMVFLLTLLGLQHRQAELRQLSPHKVGVLLLTAMLLTFNWGLYIYGVNSDRVVETSLGYFINPLVNVLLGFVFLKERLNWGQKVAANKPMRSHRSIISGVNLEESLE